MSGPSLQHGWLPCNWRGRELDNDGDVGSGKPKPSEATPGDGFWHGEMAVNDETQTMARNSRLGTTAGACVHRGQYESRAARTVQGGQLNPRNLDFVIVPGLKESQGMTLGGLDLDHRYVKVRIVRQQTGQIGRRLPLLDISIGPRRRQTFSNRIGKKAHQTRRQHRCEGPRGCVLLTRAAD